jgi:hypothetical protein
MILKKKEICFEYKNFYYFLKSTLDENTLKNEYNTCKAACFFFSLCDENSLLEIKNLYIQFRKINKNSFIFLVGNFYEIFLNKDILYQQKIFDKVYFFIFFIFFYFFLFFLFFFIFFYFFYFFIFFIFFFIL